jgi:dolichol-phosphate hexosyltransferase
MTYSLIIPIFNEERILPKLVAKLQCLDNEYIEIIIIDDGSNDSTKDILIGNNQFIVKHNKINLGKGASIKKGVEIASAKNIILIDGDLEIDINDIPKLILNYENNNSDVLTGIRWKGKLGYQSFDINVLGNYVINSIFNFLFKTNFRDVLCCVKVFNTKIFKSLDIKSHGFSIEVETMAKLVLNGYSIKEQPIKYNRRTVQEGKKLKISDSLNIIWTIFKIRLFKN